MMRKYLFLVLFTSLISACTSPIKTSWFSDEEKSKPHYKVGNPYKIDGKWYAPSYEEEFRETGVASWYGDDFHGKSTANGETFDKNEMTAAHRTLPLPSIVKVTNLNNGRSAIVRVNDRGPFSKNRVIDVSEAAAKELGMYNKGTARVKIELDKKATAELLKQEGYIKDAMKYAAKRKKFVQAGAYSAIGNAKKNSAPLNKVAPVKIETVSVDERSEKKLYKVKLGPFADARQASRFLQIAKNMGYNDAIIVSD